MSQTIFDAGESSRGFEAREGAPQVATKGFANAECDATAEVGRR